MAESSLQQGLVLLNQLDEAFASLLTPPAASASRQEQEATLTAAADHFATVAGDIERILVQARNPQPASRQEMLSQEVQQLEAALASKGKLIKHCQEQLESWKQSCDKLETDHAKTIFTT